MTEDYEQRLREELQRAHEADERATATMMGSDAHPNSHDYQNLKTSALLAAGQVIGLTTALNLLTGEQQSPSVAFLAHRDK